MRYNKSGESSSITFSKKSGCNIPVGLLNARSPLGHSGQRRLQEVVGSIEILTGIPLTFAFPVMRDK